MTYYSASGTLTNGYDHAIQFAETFTPRVWAVDADGRYVWSFGSGGGYDVSVTPGQARPETVRLEPGQTIGWSYPEMAVYTDLMTTAVGWVTEYAPGRLMAFWYPTELTRTCGTVDGWR